VLFGAHCGGGVKRSLAHAVEIGADALQLFVQSPRAWRFPDHDPADLARLLAAVRDEGADVALGSRYVPGGGVSDWGALRRFGRGRRGHEVVPSARGHGIFQEPGADVRRIVLDWLRRRA